MFALHLPLCNTSSPQHPKRTRRRAADNGLVQIACSAAQLQPSQLQQHAHQAIQEGSLGYSPTVYQKHDRRSTADHVIVSNWNGALPSLLVIPPPDMTSVVTADHYTEEYDSNLLQPLQGEELVVHVRASALQAASIRRKHFANRELDMTSDPHSLQTPNRTRQQTPSTSSLGSASAVRAGRVDTRSLTADIKQCTSMFQLEALCRHTESQQPHLARQPGVILAAAVTLHSILRSSHTTSAGLPGEEQESTIMSNNRVVAASTDSCASEVCKQHVRSTCNLLCTWVQSTAGKDVKQPHRRHNRVAGSQTAAFKPHQAVTILHALASGVKVGGPSACIPASLHSLAEGLLQCTPNSTQLPLSSDDNPGSRRRVSPSASNSWVVMHLMPAQIATAAWSLATIGPRAFVPPTQHRQDGRHAAAALTQLLTWLYGVSEPVLSKLTAAQMTRLMWGLASFRATGMQQTQSWLEQQQQQQQGITLPTDNDGAAQSGRLAANLSSSELHPLLPGPGASWWRRFEDATMPYSIRTSHTTVQHKQVENEKANTGLLSLQQGQKTVNTTQEGTQAVCGRLHVMPLTSLALCCWSASRLQCSHAFDYNSQHMQQHQQQCQYPSEAWVNALLGLIWVRRDALPELLPLSVAQLMSGLDQLQYRAKPGLLGAIIMRCSASVAHTISSKHIKKHSCETVLEVQQNQLLYNATHTHVNGHSLQAGNIAGSGGSSFEHKNDVVSNILLLEPQQQVVAAAAVSDQNIQHRPLYHNSQQSSCEMSRVKERHRSHPTRPLPLSQLVQVLRHAYQSHIHLPKSALHVLCVSFEVCLDSCSPAQLTECAVWLHGCGLNHMPTSLRPLWLAELHRAAPKLTVGHTIQLLQLLKSWDIWPGSQWMSSFTSAAIPGLQHATMVQLQQLINACLALGIRVQPSSVKVIQAVVSLHWRADGNRPRVHLDENRVWCDDTAVSFIQRQDSVDVTSDRVLSGIDEWLTAMHERMRALHRKKRGQQATDSSSQLLLHSTHSTGHHAAAVSALLLQMCGYEPGLSSTSGGHDLQLSQAQGKHTMEA